LNGKLMDKKNDNWSEMKCWDNLKIIIAATNKTK